MSAPDLTRAVELLRPPIDRFVRQSRVRLTLLIDASGRVLAQNGFVRAADVTNLAALGAGIHASSQALAEMIGEPGFAHLLQGGETGQVFLGPFATPGGTLLLIAVFGPDSSIGLVRVFFDALVVEVGALPGWQGTSLGGAGRTADGTAGDAERFDRALEGGVQRVFPPV